jgi:hypothetical protein
MRASPIACRMDALTPAERARRGEVLAILTQRALEVVETADGLAFHLRGDPDTPALAGEFVAYESRCCPFIRFQLTVEAEGGPVILALGGRQGVRDFLRAMFPAGGTRSRTSPLDKSY